MKLLSLVALLLIGFVVYAQEEVKKPEGGTTLTQYGILGTIVVALAGYILRQDHLHRKDREDQKKEREEWQKLIKEQNTEMIDVIRETNKERQEHSNILTGLKTLLDHEYKPRMR